MLIDINIFIAAWSPIPKFSVSRYPVADGFFWPRFDIKSKDFYGFFYTFRRKFAPVLFDNGQDQRYDLHRTIYPSKIFLYILLIHSCIRNDVSRASWKVLLPSPPHDLDVVCKYHTQWIWWVWEILGLHIMICECRIMQIILWIYGWRLLFHLHTCFISGR